MLFRSSVMGVSGVDGIATSRMDLAEQELGEVDVSLVEGELDLQQFLSAVASGEPPAVVYANRNQIGSLAARGAILPLDRCIDGDGIDTSMYVPAAPDQVTSQGPVSGTPKPENRRVGK